MNTYHFLTATTILSIPALAVEMTFKEYSSNPDNALESLLGSPGDMFMLSFTEPVTAPSNIGKAVDKGLISISPALDYEAVWISPTQIRFEPKEPIAFHAKHMIRVKTPLGTAEAEMQDRSTSIFARTIGGNNSYYGGFQRYAPVFLYLRNECNNQGNTIFRKKECRELLQKAYYEITYPHDLKREVEKIPALLRPATAEEVIELGAGTDKPNDILNMGDSEWADFITLPKDTEIPVVWKAAACLPQGKDAHLAEIKLIIPELSYYDEDKKAYGDLVCHATNDEKKSDYGLNLLPLSDGTFVAEIILSQPVEMSADWDSLLSKITWQQYYNKNSTFPFKNLGNGRFVCKVPEAVENASAESWVLQEKTWADVELIFDKERSHAESYEMTLSGGETKRFFRKLYFRVKGGANGAQLVANVDLQSALGVQLIPLEGNNRAHFYPILPDLSMDVEMGILPSTGKREFRIKHDRHDGARLRVHRYKNSGEEAVRVLAGYINYYQPNTYKRHLEYITDSVARKDSNIMENYYIQGDKMLFPSDIMGSEESRTLPLEKAGTQVFSLNDERLFPEAGSGLYLVELLADEMDSNKAYHDHYNKMSISAVQGLVQVSDLGLLCSTDAMHKSLFIYGHRLSTAEKLQKPRLSLYDAEAKLLLDIEISPEGSLIDLESALGKKALDIKYIQISDGDDSCTVPFLKERDNNSLYSNSNLPNYPRLLLSMINDRPIYRPGEKAHVKGYLRQLHNNEISIPTQDFVETIEVELSKSGVQLKTFEVKLEEDGSFSYDVDIPADDDAVGRYHIAMRVLNKTDEQFKSPDMLALGVTEKINRRNVNADAVAHALRNNRMLYHSLLVEEYRRNEFEIEGEYQLSDDENKVQVKVKAQQYSGAPLAKAELEVTFDSEGLNFYPTGLRDYRFGDHRDYDRNYLLSYFYDKHMLPRGGNYVYKEEKAQLDASGQADLNFYRPRNDFPLREQLTITSTVTNGNQQSLSHQSETFIIHPADYYLGIKQSSRFSEASPQPMRLEFQAVDTAGKPCAVPSELTLSITHRPASPYGEHSIMHLMHPASDEKESTQTYKIGLDASGKGSFGMPRDKVGIYTITLSGRDEKGRAFRSAIRHRVWGVEKDKGFEVRRPFVMRQDKDIYQSGETVKLLLDSPVEGNVLLTIEREGVIRHVHRKISAENPVIELPLKPEDAPFVVVKATLIEAGNQSDSGTAQIHESEVNIYMDPAEKALQVKLDLPKEANLPGESCELAGQVLDAQGKALAGASLLLYVVDEGSLQAGDYHAPALLRDFYQWRPHITKNFYSYPWLTSNILSDRRMDNDAFYMGEANIYSVTYGDYMTPAAYSLRGSGLGSGDYGGGAFVKKFSPLRKNFNPCALWLAHIKTDAEGRFKAEVKNPDTLTRYRVIAVASHGADHFGTGSGFYEVNKSIMLEGAAPLSACKGDQIEIPITVSMKASDIPQQWQRDGAVSWKLQLTGNDAVHIEEPVQTITLQGDAPVTTSFSVNMKNLGEARFEWRIVPDVDDDSIPARYQDALMESFTVRPATPYLREAHLTVLPPSSQNSVVNWVRSDFDIHQTKIDLSLSPSPLSAFILASAMQGEYYFNGSEQLSTRCLTLIYADPFHKATGTPPMDEEKKQFLLASIIPDLKSRVVYEEGFMGFSDQRYSDNASLFSSYAALVMHRIVKSDLAYASDYIKGIHQFMLDSTKTNLLGEKEGEDKSVYNASFENTLWLYLLCSAEVLSVEEFQSVLKRYAKNWVSVQDRWIIALCAQLLDAKLAEQYVEEAKLAESKFSDADIYYLPDTETIKLLLRVHQDASSLQTAEQMNNYLREKASFRYLSSYQYGWMCILLADYIEKAELQQQRAIVNGQTLTASSPLRFAKTALTALPRIDVSSDSDPVYASYSYEGFLNKEQPEQVIDKGFHVQRRYEKQQADGTWKPTAEFELGDTVRVTITAKPRESSHYVIIEDYLPAGMEVIRNHPGGLFYSLSSWIKEHKIMKDRVRFVVIQWQGTELMEASYFARVTKAGVMKAPAAKAEEMYRPQVYGLALPMTFTVKKL